MFVFFMPFPSAGMGFLFFPFGAWNADFCIAGVHLLVVLPEARRMVSTILSPQSLAVVLVSPVEGNAREDGLDVLGYFPRGRHGGPFRGP